MIRLLQTKTADTAHTEIFASDTRPLSRFLGTGDEATRSTTLTRDRAVLDSSGASFNLFPGLRFGYCSILHI